MIIDLIPATSGGRLRGMTLTAMSLPFLQLGHEDMSKPIRRLIRPGGFFYLLFHHPAALFHDGFQEADAVNKLKALVESKKSK
jgi:hypothetical protein